MKSKVVDYEQEIRDFDKFQGRKPDDFDIPLKSAAVLNGGFVSFVLCLMV